MRKQVNEVRYMFGKDGSYTPAKKSEPFLKGPIPLVWISKVSILPGKAFQTALAILWLSDMAGGGPIKLSRQAMQRFSLSADAARDAVKRLEAARVITVERKAGQRHSITLVKVGQLNQHHSEDQ
jgi:hypothetical protein